MWREDHQLEQPQELCRSRLQGEKCRMRRGEIEIECKVGEYLDEHMYRGSIKFGRRCRSLRISQSECGHIVGGGITYLAGMEMTKRIDYYKGHGENLASYQRMELVEIERRQLPEVRSRSSGERKRRDLWLQFSSTVTLISQDGNIMDGCNYFGVL